MQERACAGGSGTILEIPEEDAGAADEATLGIRLQELLQRLDRPLGVALRRRVDGLLVELPRGALVLQCREMRLRFGRLLPRRHAGGSRGGWRELAEREPGVVHLEERVEDALRRPELLRALDLLEPRLLELLLCGQHRLLRTE